MKDCLFISEVNGRPYFRVMRKTYIQRIVNRENGKELTRGEFDWYRKLEDFLYENSKSADTPLKRSILKSLKQQLADTIGWTDYIDERTDGCGYIDEIDSVEPDGKYSLKVRFKTGRNEIYECNSDEEMESVVDSLRKLANVPLTIGRVEYKGGVFRRIEWKIN